MGTLTQRISERKPAALTVSIALPPPMPTTTSMLRSLITSTTRSTSAALGTPLNRSQSAGRSAASREDSTSCATTPLTKSSATSSGVEPMGLRNSPI